MEHSEPDMKISSTVIRRLRTERGWSQEQLATASGLGLRTIQRVEAEGKAARETRVCLAATFNLPITDLLEEPGNGEALKPATSTRRYRIALVIAACTALPALLGSLGMIANTLASVCMMATIALSMYGGFGWYFTGATPHASRTKRYVQITFIAAAIFCGFASLAQDNAAATGLSAQVTVLVLAIYFMWDFLRSRHQANK